MIELVLAVSVLNLLIQIAGHAVAIYQRHKTIELHRNNPTNGVLCSQTRETTQNATQDRNGEVGV